MKDDGKGFNPKQKRSGFGIKGMQERVVIVNGQFQLTTSSGKGCRIEVTIPNVKASQNVLQLVK